MLGEEQLLSISPQPDDGKLVVGGGQLMHNTWVRGFAKGVLSDVILSMQCGLLAKVIITHILADTDALGYESTRISSKEHHTVQNVGDRMCNISHINLRG